MREDEWTVLAAVERWSKGKGKLVVALDGITGVGKTTLAESITRTSSHVAVLARDDFLLPRKILQTLLAATVDKADVFYNQALDFTDLHAAIAAFRVGNRQRSGLSKIVFASRVAKTIFDIKLSLLF